MKTAAVTGASSGIGKAICEALCADGFKVYGISRSPRDSQDNFVGIAADLTDVSVFQKILSSIGEESVDILVNDAGVIFENGALDFTDKTFAKMFDINFKAPILLTQTLKPKLRNGLVINISSVSDRLVGEGYALYCSSKAALNIYFDTVRLEEGNIKFISILPSYVDTPLLRKLKANDKTFAWNAIVKPEDIADFITEILDGKREISNGARIIVISDALREDLEYSENLWGYNVTTKELIRLKQG